MCWPDRCGGYNCIHVCQPCGQTSCLILVFIEQQGKMQHTAARDVEDTARPGYRRAARYHRQTLLSAVDSDPVEASSADAEEQTATEASEDSETELSIRSDTPSPEQTRHSDDDFVELGTDDDWRSADDYGPASSTSGSSEYWADGAAELAPDADPDESSDVSSGEDQADEASSLLRRRQTALSAESRRRALALLRLRTAIRTLSLDSDLGAEHETSLGSLGKEDSVD